jgi:putative mRNA 3-end processing factor
VALLTFTKSGIYCAQGDFYIDPTRNVKNAVITHGHADHARIGNEQYLCVDSCKPILLHRLGKINVSTLPYGVATTMNDVKVSFYPAGHIIGSAQVKVEYKGEVWVVSGDYKVENDGISEAFEPVPCHTFVTESTFALPVYQWLPQADVFTDINQWWQNNKEEGKVSVISAYSLGKAQRIISNVDLDIGPIFCHGAIQKMNEVLIQSGVKLPPTDLVDKQPANAFERSLVVSVSTAIDSSWMKKFKNYETAAASGWMQLRGMRRRGGLDRGFVLSDHADWNGLNSAIQQTGAERVYVMHGYEVTFAKYLQSLGLDAHAVSMEFERKED